MCSSFLVVLPYARTASFSLCLSRLKKSFTEQPALPLEAQAHAHAQDEAQAQEECAQEEWAQEE